MDRQLLLLPEKEYKVMGILKRLFGCRVEKGVIVDPVIYESSHNSFCGGSLADSNLLVVTNGNVDEHEIDSLIQKEKATYSLLSLSSLMERRHLTDASSELIGPFTHIINVFFEEKSDNLLTEEGRYKKEDGMYRIFQWHQQEVDYLVELSLYSTICTVFIGGEDTDVCVKKKNVEMLIRGLSEVLANHGMICNGIIADKKVPIKDIINSTLFLSSKYGQIMSGEVLQMRNQI